MHEQNKLSVYVNIPLIFGLKVVVAFIAGSALCALCALALAALDSVINKNRILPEGIQVRINARFAHHDKRHYEVWRETLERTLLSLGDQQIVTGLGLGVSFYIGFIVDVEETWPQTIIFPQALLAIYIAALSSSSHLACLTTLRGYFSQHLTTFAIRILLLLFFNLMYTYATVKADAFIYPILKGVLGVPLPDDNRLDDSPKSDFLVAKVFGYILVIGPIIYLFYLALLQNTPLRSTAELKVRFACRALGRGATRIYHTIYAAILSFLRLFKTDKRDAAAAAAAAAAPPSEPAKAAKSNGRSYHIGSLIERAIVTLLLGTPGYNFTLQQLSFVLALVFTIAQKFAPVPAPPHLEPGKNGTEDWIYYCTLKGSSIDNALDFGQLLPIVLLFLPFLTCVETYFEARNELTREKTGERKEESFPLDSIRTQFAANDNEETPSAIQQRSLEEQMDNSVSIQDARTRDVKGGGQSSLDVREL